MKRQRAESGSDGMNANGRSEELQIRPLWATQAQSTGRETARVYLVRHKGTQITLLWQRYLSNSAT